MTSTRNQGRAADEFADMYQKLKASGELDLEVLKVEIAEQIYLAMERGGTSKAELAKRLGSSRAYVTKILQGTANFTVDSLAKLARCLNSQLEIQMTPILKATVPVQILEEVPELPDTTRFKPVKEDRSLRVSPYSTVHARVNKENLDDDLSAAA